MVQKKKNKSESNDPDRLKPLENKRTPQPEEKHGKLTEAAQKIEAGIEEAGEKISEFSEKAAETANEFYKVAKDRLSSTFDSGTKIVEDISQGAQNYIDKYKQNLEIKRLTEERERLTQKLGLEFFTKLKSHKEESSILLFKNTAIQELIAEIGNLDKKIVKIGKKLEKAKN